MAGSIKVAGGTVRGCLFGIWQQPGKATLHIWDDPKQVAIHNQTYPDLSEALAALATVAGEYKWPRL